MATVTRYRPIASLLEAVVTRYRPIASLLEAVVTRYRAFAECWPGLTGIQTTLVARWDGGEQGQII